MMQTCLYFNDSTFIDIVNNFLYLKNKKYAFKNLELADTYISMLV